MAQQFHIFASGQPQAARSSLCIIPAENAQSLRISRISRINQKSYTSRICQIGEICISLDAIHPSTCHIGSIIIGYSLDTAIDLIATIFSICQEYSKLILAAFQGYALATLGIHHRCINLDTYCLLNNTASFNGERIVFICKYISYSKSIIRRRHFLPSGNIPVDVHISTSRQRNIAFEISRSIVIPCLQCRKDFNAAIGIPVFNCNIARYNRLNEKFQIVCGSLDQNIARNRHISLRSLYRNRLELIASSLQVHRLGAGSSYLCSLDACILSLLDICRCRGQFHILACREDGIFCLGQGSLCAQGNIARSSKVPLIGQTAILTEIGYRDIPCHIPLDFDSQSSGIVLDADITGNIRLFLRIGRRAIHRDAVEVVLSIFQKQGLAVEGLNLIGSDGAFVCLGDATVGRRQRQILFRDLGIPCGHCTVQCQIFCSGKRHIASGVNATCHCGLVLFLFPSHGQGAFACRDELFFRVDSSEDQGAVPDICVIHALDIGRLRRDVHRGAIVQDADCMSRITHNTSIGFGVELQCLSGVDVGLGDFPVGIAHQEALVAIQGNGIFGEHGSQTEIIVIVRVLDEHIFVGPDLCHIPGQVDCQGLVRRADALLATGEDQVLTLDVRPVGICEIIVDSQFGMQAHIAILSGVNRAHLEGRVLPVFVLAARHGDIAARLHIESAAGLDAQGHIALDLKGRQIACCVLLGGDIRSTRIHKLLHVVNFIIPGQLLHSNSGGRVGESTHCALGRTQRDVLAQDIGSPFRLDAAAAVLVHQLVADGVKHHVLGPLKVRICCLIRQGFIGGVIRQIIACVGVLRVLVCGCILQIPLRIFVLRVSDIVLMTILHQFCHLCLIGKSCVHARTRFVGLIIGGGVNLLYLRLLRLILLLPLSLGRACISRFYVCLVVVAVFFQSFDIRPLVSVISIGILLAVNEARVYPAMHHLVHAVRGAGFVIAGKPVNEAAVIYRQLHIPFAGFNLAHAHIAASFRLGQIDAVLGTGVYLGTIAVCGINQIRASHVDGLRFCANTALLASESDTAALYGNTAARLGDIPGGVQSHVTKSRTLREGVASVLALEFDDFHIPRQGTIRQYATYSGNVDVSLISGNGTELDVVIHRCDIAIGIFGRRAEGDEMDILDVVLRRKIHNLALQGGVVKLGNAACCGAYRQGGLIVRVGHIARQVDAAAAGISALDVNFTHFCAKQANRERLRGIKAVIIELDGGSANFPPVVNMLEPAQEPRSFNPMLLTKNFFVQKRGMSVKMQFAACRNIVARRNHGTFGQA